ncbi:MAG: hypothetical protein E7240_00700 [Lachnospiraceae bacterium]|nr:hypothetical protein [Lachnospiraceae bacterium]
MKKIISLILITVLSISAAACGRQESAAAAAEESYSEPVVIIGIDDPDPSEEYTYEEPDYYEESYEDNYEESYEEMSSADPSAIRWTTMTCDTTDSDGYTTRQTVQMSPWIHGSDTETLQIVWGQVSGGKSFPDSGCFGSGTIYYPRDYTMFYDYDEIIYTVGTIEAENVTPGFDITESSPRRRLLGISTNRAPGVNDVSEWMIMTAAFSNGCENYDVDSSEYGCGGFWFTVTMKSNHWGKVPFVIACPQKYTPNEPDGTINYRNCAFFLDRENKIYLEDI